MEIITGGCNCSAAGWEKVWIVLTSFTLATLHLLFFHFEYQLELSAIVGGVEVTYMNETAFSRLRVAVHDGEMPKFTDVTDDISEIFYVVIPSFIFKEKNVFEGLRQELEPMNGEQYIDLGKPSTRIMSELGFDFYFPLSPTRVR